MLCQPDGGVIDDLIVYGRGPNDYFLCINAGNIAKDVDWIHSQFSQGHWNCSVEHLSHAYAQLALQGPASGSILQPLVEFALADLARFGFREATVAGYPASIART